MAESDLLATRVLPPETASRGSNTDNYPMSPEGRRQAIVLLLGVASLWVFAVWSLINLFEGGLGGIEWVSLVLMLGLVLVAPIVAWALLEEANSRITTSDTGIHFHSLAGIDLHYEWSELSGFQPKDRKGKVARFFLGDDDKEEGIDEADSGDEEPEPDTRLLDAPDHTAQIKNTVARIMHRLSHGSSLLIYGGIECRDDLLKEITSHIQVQQTVIEQLGADNPKSTKDEGRSQNPKSS